MVPVCIHTKGSPISFIDSIVCQLEAIYARLCGVSARGLQDVEREVKSLPLDTVAKLLRPLGLRLSVVTRDTVEKAAREASQARE
jgi:hypothetical protein